MSSVIFIPGGDSDPSVGGGVSSFETVNRNLKAYPYALNYIGKDTSDIVYDLGGGFTITKTFGYTGKDLTTITLSGDIPMGIDTIKTLGYTSGNLTSISYS